MVKVFVYGTLKRNNALNSYMDNSYFVSIGKLDNYALYQDNLPLIVKEKDKSVIGEIYEVDIDTLRILDFLEGGYIREFEKIKVNNGMVNAYVYTQIVKKGVYVESGIF